MTAGPVAAAAAEAPTGAGVYFFLGADRTLLYVGKAGNLRQRLRQHARPAPDRRLAALAGAVREVRWEALVDEPAAAAREADLIVALRPAFNAAVVGDARWAYVVTADAPDGRLALSVTATPGAGPRPRRYGCFPHLGRGVSTAPAIACSEGYAALIRLLWAADPSVQAGAGDRDRGGMPARLAGPSPPDAATLAVAAAHRRPLHDLLTGTSDRLVAALAAEGTARRSPVMGPALRSDAGAARAFFAAGPRAVRDLRRRHGLPPGPVDRATVVAALTAEVQAAIGEIRLPDAPDPTAGLLGRRDERTRSLRAAIRRADC